jgi:hypothetical protein
MNKTLFPPGAHGLISILNHQTTYLASKSLSFIPLAFADARHSTVLVGGMQRYREKPDKVLDL